jgi:hypothetical protein
MSRRDKPSTVPAGQALDGGTNGTGGTLGTGGTSGTIGTVTTANPTPPEVEAAIEERAGLAADRVPLVYLDAWGRLNCQKPFRVSEGEWRLALDDGGRFLDQYGKKAAAIGWTPGELFDVGAGVVWQLAGELVLGIGSYRVLLQGGRGLDRRR